MCLSMCLLKKSAVRDFSHLESPKQAATVAHSIKNYDLNVGEFKYNGTIFKLGDNGFYQMTGYYNKYNRI